MTQPDRERIQLWVEALKSGEYKQTRGCLRDDLRAPGEARSVGEPEWGYCCLGVAIEVALRNGLEAETGWGSSYNTLWPEVVAWYGLPDEDPWVQLDPDHGSVTAISANDEKQWIFPQIAEGIQTIYLPDEDVAE